MIKLVVLYCLLAATSAGFIAPLAYPAPLAYSATVLASSNYRGPLSLAPGQPANILAADGRPLDVNLDRAAHYTAKALNNGFHLLKKRSVIAPIIAAPIVRISSPADHPHCASYLLCTYTWHRSRCSSCVYPHSSHSCLVNIKNKKCNQIYNTLNKRIW
ncbi:unnamed protein product [Parnassius apollo]|uniref:(apollo) hypothetical protein n=1 Tax=Parnassius apollo TaxID=110799 RepID=A0A8S3XJ98_PARAO|nr:unnamed protein product [Parnassius apollo]